MYILFYLFHVIGSNSVPKHLRLEMRLNFLHLTLSLWMSRINYLMSSSSIDRMFMIMKNKKNKTKVCLSIIFNFMSEDKNLGPTHSHTPIPSKQKHI